jgi:hypothetical protein
MAGYQDGRMAGYYLGGKYIDALTKIVTAKLSVNGI